MLPGCWLRNDTIQLKSIWDLNNIVIRNCNQSPTKIELYTEPNKLTSVMRLRDDLRTVPNRIFGRGGHTRSQNENIQNIGMIIPVAARKHRGGVFFHPGRVSGGTGVSEMTGDSDAPTRALTLPCTMPSLGPEFVLSHTRAFRMAAV